MICNKSEKIKDETWQGTILTRLDLRRPLRNGTLQVMIF
jgi:hypothetical protein